MSWISVPKQAGVVYFILFIYLFFCRTFSHICWRFESGYWDLAAERSFQSFWGHLVSILVLSSYTDHTHRQTYIVLSMLTSKVFHDIILSMLKLNKGHLLLIADTQTNLHCPINANTQSSMTSFHQC
jgi:hypothetical protein